MSNNEESQDSQNPYRPPVSPSIEFEHRPRPGRPLLFYLFISFPVAWMIAGILSSQVIVPLASSLLDSRQALIAILFVSWVLLTISMTGLTAVMNKRQFENPETTMRWKIATVVVAILAAMLFVMYMGAIVYRSLQ